MVRALFDERRRGVGAGKLLLNPRATVLELSRLRPRSLAKRVEASDPAEVDRDIGSGGGNICFCPDLDLRSSVAVAKLNERGTVAPRFIEAGPSLITRRLGVSVSGRSELRLFDAVEFDGRTVDPEIEAELLRATRGALSSELEAFVKVAFKP